jgi:hypothetical protein
VSTVEGLQVPVIPFNEVVGKMGGVEPAQIVVEDAPNTGTVTPITVIDNDTDVAHCPASGVKV